MVKASALSSPSLIQEGSRTLKTPIANPPPFTPFSALGVLCNSYQVYCLLLGVFILPDLHNFVSGKIKLIVFQSKLNVLKIPVFGKGHLHCFQIA